MSTIVKDKNTILSDTFSIAFFTMISRISGFIRDVFLARYLGVGLISDVFFLAWRVPNSFRRLIADGSINSAFVPIYVRLKSSDDDSSRQFAGGALSAVIAISLIIVILLEIFTPQVIRVIAPGFTENNDQFNMVVCLTRIMLPFLILISSVSIFGGILNGIKVFSYFAAVQVVLNLSIISCSIFFHSNSDFVYLLSYSTMIGGLLQLVFIVFACKLYKVLPSFKGIFNSNLSTFLKTLFPVFISQGIFQINIFVGGIFASLIPGAVSYLYYTDRIALFATTIIGNTLGTVVLPVISKSIANGNKNEGMLAKEFSIRWCFILSMPAAISIFILSKEIINALYVSSKFTNADAIIVAKMLQIYAISIPFISINRILTSCFYAHLDTKMPMRVGTISALINMFLNLILFRYLSYYAMITSTVICVVVETMILAFLLRKKHDFFNLSNENIKVGLKTFFSGLLVSLMVDLCMRFATGNVPSIIFLLPTIGFAAVLYFVMISKMKIIKSDEIKGLIFKRS